MAPGKNGHASQVASARQMAGTARWERRGGDSNPRGGLSRQQHFQCCAFSRSATSPGFRA